MAHWTARALVHAGCVCEVVACGAEWWYREVGKVGNRNSSLHHAVMVQQVQGGVLCLFEYCAAREQCMLHAPGMILCGCWAAATMASVMATSAGCNASVAHNDADVLGM